MEDREIVLGLAALAHPIRLRVFRALVVAGDTGLSPGVMAESAGLPAATMSFHLKELSHAGLIGHEQQGRYRIYRARFDRMAQLIRTLTANCCTGGVCAVTEIVPPPRPARRPPARS